MCTRTYAIFFLWVLGPLACDEPAAELARLRAGAEPNAPQGTSRAPRRGPVLGGEPIAREIAWPSAADVDADARARLDRDALDAVDRAPVPVLMPKLALDDVLVVTGAHWYSFRGERDGLTIVVSGSGQARHFPGLGAARYHDRVRGHAGLVSINEGIRHAAWIERGAAYALEVECTNQDIPACADDTFIRELAGELVLAGGAGIEEVAR